MRLLPAVCAILVIPLCLFTSCMTDRVVITAVSPEGGSVELVLPLPENKGTTEVTGGQSIVFPTATGEIVVTRTEHKKGAVIAESASQKKGATIFYSCAGISAFLSLLFVWFKHFKLAMLCGVAVGMFTGLGVTIGRFPEIYAYGAAGLGVLLLAFIGWKLWEDYKDDGRFNLSNI